MKKTQWLATRVLQDSANPENNIEVQLGFPVQLDSDDWRCAFRVKGLGRSKTEQAGGIDALQALMNGIEGIATRLRESGRTFTWLGGDNDIRQRIPVLLGVPFAEKIEGIIEQKYVKLIKREERRLGRQLM